MLILRTFCKLSCILFLSFEIGLELTPPLVPFTFTALPFGLPCRELGDSGIILLSCSSSGNNCNDGNIKYSKDLSNLAVHSVEAPLVAIFPFIVKLKLSSASILFLRMNAKSSSTSWGSIFKEIIHNNHSKLKAKS